MSLLFAIKSYLVVNVLIALVCVLMTAIWTIGRHFAIKIRYAHLLKLCYALIALSLAFPLILLPQQSLPVWVPQTQVWSALSTKDMALSDSAFIPRPALVSFGEGLPHLSLDAAHRLLLVLFTFGWLFVLLRIAMDSWKLAHILRESFLFKRIGRVQIVVSEAPLIPCSAWLPLRSVVIMPSYLLADATKLSLVIKHELQHHRQRDTQWIYVLQLVKALCFWNPFVYALQKLMAKLQEVACDETLTGQQSVSSLAYCDCLLWVAQQTVWNRAQLVGTAGFTRSSAANVLQWRIEEMMNTKPKYLSAVVTVCAGLLATGFLTVATAATQSSVQDRRITRDDAEKMVEVAQSYSFPVEMNELVLAQLNRYLGTPDGRKFLRRSFTEMKNYEASISTMLDTYHLPHELLAVPVVESGFRNLKPDGQSGHGAGLWMFIPQTAKRYGLKVDDKVDERLDPMLETDAALRMLGSLNLQFKDWGLALFGYNTGENMVLRGMQETHSRDVWTLVRKGYGNDVGYVASVMAVVLIMKNPGYLD